MTISSNLNNIISIQKAIKLALKSKNVTPGKGMVSYPDDIRRIQTGGDVPIIPDGTKFGWSLSVSFPAMDTSNVTDMSSFFKACYRLQYSPELDTSNVTDMGLMFYDCRSLKSIPYMNTSNVTDMTAMFWECRELKAIPAFDMSNVKYVYWMFYKSHIEELPLLDMQSVVDGYLFDNSFCHKLGGFKDLKVSMSGGFIEKLDLDVDSLMNVINNLYDWSGNTDGFAPLKDGTMYDFGKSHYLKFGEENLNRLTDEQIAVATSKGWILS